MRLTTKSRYAVSALIELSFLESTGPVSLSDIATNQNIELNYLEQLFVKLRRKNVVESVRGANGGYKLAKSSGNIRLSDILEAVDENVNALHIGEGVKRTFEGSKAQDLAEKFWEQLSSSVFLHLHQTRLEDLVEGHISPCKAVPNFVHIVDE